MAPGPITLQQALKVERLQELSYKAVIPLDRCYDICKVLFILTAIKQAFQYDLTTVDQPHTIDLHVAFLRPTLSGEVHIEIQDARLESSTSIFRFTLSQRGKNCLTGFASNAHVSNSEGLSFATGYSLHLSPAPVDFPKLALDQDPNWIALKNEWYPESPYKGFSHTTMFLPIHGTAQPAVMELWSCPKPIQDRFTNEMLGSFVDTYPKVVESMRDHGASKWGLKAVVERSLHERQGQPLEDATRDMPWTYPTLSLALEQKKPLPPEGVRWWYMRAETKKIVSSRWDVEIVVCDEHMDIVALSHQVNLIVNVVKQREKAAEDAVRSRDKVKL